MAESIPAIPFQLLEPSDQRRTVGLGGARHVFVNPQRHPVNFREACERLYKQKRIIPVPVSLIVSSVQIPANGNSRYHRNEFSRKARNKSVTYPPDLYSAKIDG